MEKEIIKDIPGYKGLYKASSKGFILSKKRRGSSGGILRPNLNRDGYLYVSLNGKTLKVHKLICITFHIKIPGKDFVDHKDGNKLNNASENVRWCTFQENIDFAWGLGLYSSEKSSNAILTLENVKIIKELLLNKVRPKEILPLFPIKINAIYDIKQGRTWKNV